MPRRYSDYPDAYTTWNVVSSMGRYTSLVAVIIFSIILWEAIRSGRTIESSFIRSSSIEWLQNTPPSDHSYIELALLTEF